MTAPKPKMAPSAPSTPVLSLSAKPEFTPLPAASAIALPLTSKPALSSSAYSAPKGFEIPPIEFRSDPWPKRIWNTLLAEKKAPPSLQVSLVSLALKFAAASYEKKDGTDEETVFKILREVASQDEAVKREFEDILVSMAKSNHDGGESYFEKVVKATASGDFVSKVIEYEMKGWFVQSEYKEAMAIWKYMKAMDPEARDGFEQHVRASFYELGVSRESRLATIESERERVHYSAIQLLDHPYRSDPMEDTLEGLLNSVAALGDMALDHPILTGAMIGLGAGAVLSGVFPLIAAGAAEARLLAALPHVMTAFSVIGSAFTGFEFLKMAYHQGSAMTEFNPYLRSKELRKGGEALGNFFLMGGFSKASNVLGEGKSIAKSVGNAQRVLAEADVSKLFEKLKYLEKNEAVPLPSIIAFIDNFTYLRRHYDGNLEQLLLVYERLDVALLSKINHDWLWQECAKMEQMNPEQLERTLAILQKVFSPLGVADQFNVMSWSLALPPARRVAFLENLPPLQGALENFRASLLATATSTAPHEKFIKMLEWLEALRESHLNGLDAKQVMKGIKSWVEMGCEGALVLEDAERARLVDVLFSEPFRQQGLPDAWIRLLPQLDRTTIETLEISLDLQLLDAPGSPVFARAYDTLKLFKAMWWEEGGAHVPKITLASESEWPMVILMESQNFRSVLVTREAKSNGPYLFGAGRNPQGERMQWLPQGEAGVLEVRRHNSTEQIIPIKSGDAEKIEAALLGLLEKTGYTGDLSLIPWWRRRNPLPELKNEQGEAVVNLKF